MSQINFFHDDPVTLQTAARMLGKSYPTVFRWVNHGLGGVKLESLVVGNRRMTTKAAIQRFFDRVTEAKNAKLGCVGH